MGLVENSAVVRSGSERGCISAATAELDGQLPYACRGTGAAAVSERRSAEPRQRDLDVGAVVRRPSPGVAAENRRLASAGRRQATHARAAPPIGCRAQRCGALSKGEADVRRAGAVRSGQLVRTRTLDTGNEQALGHHEYALWRGRAGAAFPTPHFVVDAAVAAAARGMGNGRGRCARRRRGSTHAVEAVGASGGADLAGRDAVQRGGRNLHRQSSGLSNSAILASDPRPCDEVPTLRRGPDPANWPLTVGPGTLAHVISGTKPSPTGTNSMHYRRLDAAARVLLTGRQKRFTGVHVHETTRSSCPLSRIVQVGAGSSSGAVPGHRTQLLCRARRRLSATLRSLRRSHARLYGVGVRGRRAPGGVFGSAAGAGPQSVDRVERRGAKARHLR